MRRALPKSTRRPGLAGRVGLVSFGLVLGLVLVELCLRVAAPLLSAPRGGALAATTILCVGDSHTYGLHVPAGFDYPSRLQEALDPTAREIGVVNRGVPGRNSAALRARLPRYLEETGANVVLLLVGFNDAWNFDDTGAAESDGVLGDLRILKLLRLARMNLAGDPAPSDGPRVVHRDGRMVVIEDGVERPAAVGGSAFGVMDLDAQVARVSDNVEAMVATCRRRGATPVLLTYATGNQPSFVRLNDNARALAARLGAPIVEVDRAFDAAIGAQGYGALFFDDDHPNAAGNLRVAEVVADRLCALGLARRVTPDVPLAPDPAPSLTVSARGDEVVFEVRAAPRRNVQVVLSAAEGPPFAFQGVEIPLGAHPLLWRCLESTNLRGRTDDVGRATLTLPRSFLDAEPGPVHAAALSIPPGAPVSVSARRAVPTAR